MREIISYLGRRIDYRSTQTRGATAKANRAQLGTHASAFSVNHVTAQAPALTSKQGLAALRRRWRSRRWTPCGERSQIRLNLADVAGFQPRRRHLGIWNPHLYDAQKGGVIGGAVEVFASQCRSARAFRIGSMAVRAKAAVEARALG